MMDKEIESIIHTLENLKRIDGIAVGAAGTPGAFYSSMKQLLEYSKDTILPQFSNLTSSVRKLAHFILQIHYLSPEEIPIPWKLLENMEILNVNPFGCAVKQKTLGSIVWNQITDKNYFGIFTKDINNINAESKPIYPILKIKKIAFKLLCNTSTESYNWDIINWLCSQDDYFGRIEYEKSVLIEELKSNPFFYADQEISRIFDRFSKFHHGSS